MLARDRLPDDGESLVARFQIERELEVARVVGVSLLANVVDVGKVPAVPPLIPFVKRPSKYPSAMAVFVAVDSPTRRTSGGDGPLDGWTTQVLQVFGEEMIAAVPEPATGLMVVLGLVGLVSRHRVGRYELGSR